MFLKRLASAAALSIAAMFGAAPSHAALIDLGFVFDRSTSINSTDFALARTALANAIALIPVDNPDVQYRIGVASFGTNGRTEVAPTILTAATQATVLASINAMTQVGGGATAMADGIDRLVADFAALAGGLGDFSLMNMTTDGQPNNLRDVGTTGNSFTDTVNAAADAAAAGWDSLSIEAVGSGANSVSALTFLSSIAFPTPVQIVASGGALPNPLVNSFVLQVTDFGAYGDAIAAKVRRIVDDTGGGSAVVPLPAAGWMLLAALGGLTVLRRRSAA
jgi:hypothetical protein